MKEARGEHYFETAQANEQEALRLSECYHTTSEESFKEQAETAWAKTLDDYTKAASMDHPESMVILAKMLTGERYLTNGIEMDYIEDPEFKSPLEETDLRAAELLWQRAADHYQHRIAALELGLLYYNGCEKVPANLPKAKYYLDQCAEQGDPLAWATLGVMYNKGQGVIPDFDRSIKCFSLSEQLAHFNDHESQLKFMENLSKSYWKSSSHKKAS
jgi:TPR repeat protein